MTEDTGIEHIIVALDALAVRIGLIRANISDRFVYKNRRLIENLELLPRPNHHSATRQGSSIVQCITLESKKLLSLLQAFTLDSSTE